MKRKGVAISVENNDEREPSRQDGRICNKAVSTTSAASLALG
jgi:hypothetical protein